MIKPNSARPLTPKSVSSRAFLNLIRRLEVGDKILIKPACRWPTRWEWRVVRSFALDGVLVRFAGADCFFIKPNEIKAIKTKTMFITLATGDKNA